MGYVVLYLEKVKGMDSRMFVYIECIVYLKNVDRMCIYLNWEFV